jgi:nicotinate phosphoribosyltransferase
MEKGKMISNKKPLTEIASYCKEQLKLLPDEFKRFQNPHTYKIGISKSLMAMRDDLKDKFVNG